MLTQKDFDQIEELMDGKLEEKFDEKFRLLPTKEEFFDKMDKVMGELITIREQQEIITGKHSEHSDQLENHESRIEKLEKSLPAMA